MTACARGARTAARAARPGPAPGAAGPRSRAGPSRSRMRPFLDDLLELADRAVDQDLRRAVGLAQRAGDLAVVHAEREAHDQGLAPVVRQLGDAGEDARELIAALDQVLRGVRRADRRRLVQRGLRLARAVAVVVRGQVVGDPDEPRPQRPALALA